MPPHRRRRDQLRSPRSIRARAPRRSAAGGPDARRRRSSNRLDEGRTPRASPPGLVSSIPTSPAAAIRAPRSGYRPFELIAVVCDGRADADAGMTLPELATTMVELGAVEAINLDGGGSASLVVGGELANVPREEHGAGSPGGRPISTAITFVVAARGRLRGDGTTTLASTWMNKYPISLLMGFYFALGGDRRTPAGRSPRSSSTTVSTSPCSPARAETSGPTPTRTASSPGATSCAVDFTDSVRVRDAAAPRRRRRAAPRSTPPTRIGPAPRTPSSPASTTRRSSSR